MKHALMLGSLLVFAALNSLVATDPSPEPESLRLSCYNVVWNSPSKDASGVMPIGNGDIAAGVYAIEGGDLFLLLSKNDSYSYAGDILKTGRVRVSVSPSPFQAGKPFRQVLDLATGSIEIQADGVTFRIWADANRSVYHVQISSPHEVSIKARPEFWERFDLNPANQVLPDKTGAASGDKVVAKDVCLERNGRILWYYAVGDRSVFSEDLKYYGVGQMASEFKDPFRYNTFGNLLEGAELRPDAGALAGSGKSLDIRVHSLTMQTPQAETWIEAIERQAAKPSDAVRDWEQHVAWWSEFWGRSRIYASDRSVGPEARGLLCGEATSGMREEEDGAALVAQSYNVFRFLMACQSRGSVQTKFNGGLFTQQLRVKDSGGRVKPAQQADGFWLTHEDDRAWGRRFTYQNQRLLYWPLLASGDFDLMKPFLDYYWHVLPVRKAITKAWFGHDGAYYRENIEPTGCELDCGKDGRPPKTKPGETYEGWYHDYYFTCGLETTAMMIDYVNFTGDLNFRDEVLVPYAREVLLFFDRHFPRDGDGKIRLEPAQVLETWWVAVNPTPDVAGLRFCLDELLAMKSGTADDQQQWRRFRAEIPEISLQTIDGHAAIAPAAKWSKQQNAENGELYAVFPFRCFGLALGTGDLVTATMKNRKCVDSFGGACWTQDQIDWAMAGNAAEAADGLVRRFRVASPMCRFPLYGREGPDSCPDFDHFGSGSVALQRMLVQEAGEKIFLLPAWPRDWDVDFKLHLTRGAVITGKVKDGKLTEWDVQPPLRKNDVTVCPLQESKGAGGPIPPNSHPLRAGSDQSGANRFRGQIGRVTMFRGKLSQQTIHDLAAGDRSQAVTAPEVVGSWLSPKVGETLPASAEDFAGAVSFEAWVLPDKDEQGRILDKLTPGRDDGFLLDAWPGSGLRLIAGNRHREFRGVLKPDVWQHVGAVMDTGRIRIYLNGQLLQ